jgi:RNA polymerase sigma-70 factor (ECF subfamily)
MPDDHQFESFMRDYLDMVFTVACRLLGDETEAEDISQEVFIRAYKIFDQLVDSPTAGGWLKIVTRNLCINHLKRFRNKWCFFSEIESNSTSDQQTIEIPVDSVQLEQINENELHVLIEQLLCKLPDSQRVPLVLYHFEGMTYEEIAAELNISLGKVKTDIFRARECLRKKLSSRFPVACAINDEFPEITKGPNSMGK